VVAAPVAGPSLDDLQAIYAGIRSTDTSQRVNTLIRAVTWFGKALESGLLPPPGDFAKFEMATKLRNIDGRAIPEQESYLRKAISIYEGLWPQTSKLAPFYAYLEEHRQEIEAEEAAIVADRQEIIDILNQAYQPLGVTFVARAQEKQRLLNLEENQIKLSYELVDLLSEKLDDEGVLPLLFSERRTALRLYGYQEALDPNDSTKTIKVYDAAKANRGMVLADEGIMAFLSANKTMGLFKKAPQAVEASAIPKVVPPIPVVTPQQAPAPAAQPRKKRTPQATVVGSGASIPFPHASKRYRVFMFLADEKVHPIADVLLAGSGQQGAIDSVVKVGNRSSRWVVNRDWTNDTYQMTIIDLTLKGLRP
jgi:hypothetical protein